MKSSRVQIEDSLLIGLLAFAPLALGSVHVWAYCILATLSLIIFDLHFLNNIDKLKRVLTLPISVGAVAFIGLTCLYVIPFPEYLIKVVTPGAYTLRQTYMLAPVSWQTISIYAYPTITSIIKLISYVMVFLVVVSKISLTKNENQAADSSHPEFVPHTFILLGALTGVLTIIFHSFSDFNLRIPSNALYFTVFSGIIAGIGLKKDKSVLNLPFIKKLVNSVIIIGFVVAVFGIIQRFSWNGKIYWLIRKKGGIFGPFINYDHFAGYMGMCASLAVAYFMACIRYSSFFQIKKVKEKLLWFSSKEANMALIYLFLSTVMITALFLTTSRGGILSFSAAMLVFFFACIVRTKRKRRSRVVFSILLIGLLFCVLVIWIGPEPTVERFRMLNRMTKVVIKEKPILSEIRPLIWKDTLKVIKDYPVTGTGMGTFSYIFPKYRSFRADDKNLKYAHSDYLQLVSETGIFGLVFAIGFLLWYLKMFGRCLRGLREQE